MKELESYLLGKLVYYVDTEFAGVVKHAANALGLAHGALGTWVDYYNSDGEKGCNPKIKMFGKVLDKIGVYINIDGTNDYIANMPQSNFSALEKLFYAFLVPFVEDEHSGDVVKAAKALHIDRKLIKDWMAYYHSNGQYGTTTYLSTVASTLEKMGVVFTFPVKEKQSDQL